MGGKKKVVHCPICLQKGDLWMVQCDGCNIWFHQACVGLTEEQALALPQWLCNGCIQQQAINEALIDSMQHNFPANIASSTWREEPNQTVVHKSLYKTMSKTLLPEELSIAKEVSRSHEQTLKSGFCKGSVSLKDVGDEMSRLEAEKAKIQREIDETAMKLEQLRTGSSADEIVMKPVPVRKHKSEVLPRFGSSTRAPSQNDFVSPDLIRSQLKAIQDRLDRIQGEQNIPRNTQQVQSPLVRFNYEGTGSSSLNSLNMGHWMARQTAGPLPNYDGKPGAWPSFYKAFVRTTDMCGFTDDENQERLRNCLTGPALEMVESYLGTSNALPIIIKTLEQVFGRPEQTLNFVLSRIRNEPPPKSEKPETFVRFAMAVRNVWSTMEEANMKIHMNNPQVLQELVDKLPLSFKFQWASYIIDMEEYDVATFAKWLDKIIQKTMLVVPNMDLYSAFEDKSDKKRTPKAREHTYTHKVKSEEVKGCGACEGECPMLSDCKKFLEASNDEKWRIIRALGVCKQCLNRHPIRPGMFCKDLVKCTEKDCKGRHHPAMHPRASEEQKKTENDTNVFNGTHQMGTSKPHFRYLPIILRNGDVSIHTYAFMDEGSSGTLMEEELARSLNLTGTRTTLHVSYTADCSHTESSMLIESVGTSGAYEGASTVQLKNVQTVKKLGLATQSLDYIEEAARYPFLKGLPIASYNEVQPKLLIGLNNWNFAVPTKIRFSSSDEPIAARCTLGWTMFAGKSRSQEHHLNYHKIEEEPESLHDRLKNWMSIDSLGVALPQNNLPSREDRRAVDLLKSNTRKTNDRYETGLLWKYDKVDLPDSRQMALRRMICLETRMKKDPIFNKAVRDQMNEWFELGYVRKLSQEELSEKRRPIWYLPLFAVFNPNKPGKTRLVLDAKADVNGISLNSVLLKGPDANASLFQVLLRFRKRRVGISGDIRHMFQQVRMKDADQHAQRFLWRDKFDKDPEVCVVQVMTFGATCSPSSAQYVKNTNALKYQARYPRAVHAIVDNHYVDDLLDSMDDAVETVAVVRQIQEIHKEAGFEIGKWKSNSDEVMRALGGDAGVEQKNMDIDQDEDAEKVLGMWWRLKDDCFTYSLRYNKGNAEVLSGERAPTRVEMLRVLMSVYDPLGLIAHFLARLKVIMQDTCRTGKQWNDVIDGDTLVAWKKWLAILPSVESIRIPRCYLSSLKDWKNASVQLHVFVDASDECSAAVAYFRIERNGEVNCPLISAKTKVAPIKLTSIPRLELAGALLGARLVNSICQAIDVVLQKVVLWSDSKPVLSWLRSDTRKIKGQYVAFRVSEIQDTTDVNDWRYVPTRLNPADDATKWSRASQLQNNSRWFQGPDFLYQPDDQWPEDDSKGYEVKEEMRYEIVLAHHVMTPLIDFERFSRWKRMVRAVAYVHRFVNNLRAKVRKLELKGGMLTHEELEAAEMTVIKAIQLQGYPSEVRTLSQTREGFRPTVDDRSSISSLSPVMISGLIHCKGRSNNLTEEDKAQMGIEDCTVRPIILPPTHYGTKLLIRSYHEKFYHIHHDTVMNEIKKTWLGRVALFTCLTSRAIHLEILSGMDHDSFILAFRNFTQDRGHPKEVYTDNGTNFVKAESVLRKDWLQMNMAAIAEPFVSSSMKWFFNPPLSPHMGGSWERLVKSVKHAFYAMDLKRKMTDPLLYSLMKEIQNIINSRPLTYIPLDDESSEAITPNHLIRLDASGGHPIGQFSDESKILKWNWQMSQLYARHFWKRWTLEYLPELTRRSKWFRPVTPLKPGDLVLVVEPEYVRNCWQRGRIVEVFQGKDKQVRSARVQTATGFTTRPAVRLAKLDVEECDVSASSESRHQGEDVEKEQSRSSNGDIDTMTDVKSIPAQRPN